MSRYIGRRVLALLPVLLVVAVIVFSLIHLIPGDPAAVMLGSEASAAQVAALRHSLGLDRPLVIQFLIWFGRTLRGDLGQSVFLNEPVTRAIGQHLGPTASLTAFAEVLSLAVALPAGVLAAWKRDTPYDQLFMGAALLGVAIPSFWLGLLLIGEFAVKWQVFPVAGYVSPLHSVGGWLRSLVLPGVSLAATQVGLTARMARDATIDVLGEDYIRTARSKGLPDMALLIRHAFRNALVPTLTVIGTSLATLLGGAVVIETVFVLPGLGELVVNAINQRDYPVVEGVVLFVALLYVLINLVVDLVYAWIDPRIRYD
jgi:peptide/nickel transport system permease protein